MPAVREKTGRSPDVEAFSIRVKAIQALNFRFRFLGRWQDLSDGNGEVWLCNI
jgi:hypothetical protein